MKDRYGEGSRHVNQLSREKEREEKLSPTSPRPFLYIFLFRMIFPETLPLILPLVLKWFYETMIDRRKAG